MSWVGVDLDGTLARRRSDWSGGQIGEPVPAMLARVKKWLAEGKDVRIFTARVGFGAGYSERSGRSDDEGFIAEQRELIEAWCLEHLGRVLPVTAVKDFACAEIWDDIAVPVERDTGRRLDMKSD